MPPPSLFPLESLDFDNPQFDLDEIRKVNPQRHEMEQLTAVLTVDRESQSLAGYKDLGDNEFWITGHMPGFPLMPGVVMCECAAQLAGFYARKYNVLGGDYVGFGGMNDVKFRYPVFPGDRLVLMAMVTKVRPHRRAEFDFQGFVSDRMVFCGSMFGVPIDRDQKID
ncbi:MAG TPA: beta-hydroxyacyl-ACP dehydratase [Planctomycetaceae bacterium]|nr:beta-hydroxyacyl-ACP dehydratase [Planctomycetaceae bacterium]HAA52957.1 beta-hydroxyacyl-ACP dehydratase [Planctomycetaceae bacterium]|tara:strand:+ start:1565 stop:2065 length:501 start_codon:yes stop_codon:yes gene_type:complete